MNKFKKIILTISLLFKKPSLVNLIVDSEYYWDNYVAKKLPDFKKLPSVDLVNFLANDAPQLSYFSFLGGGSLPTDILLLKEICSKIPNCSYFEIGTWRGESVINVAEVAKECFTLHLSEQEMIALGFSKKMIDLHGILSKKKGNITHLIGNSLTFDFKSLQKKFDVVFIDGNHQYDFVKNDTKKVFEYLVSENSIVIWHDYAFNPEKIRSEVLAGILDGIPQQFKKNLYHVSNTMCAIYYPKKIVATNEIFPIKPIKNFKIDFTITSNEVS